MLKGILYEELQNKINVQVRVVSTKSELEDTSYLKFDINDNLEKMLAIFSIDKTGGQLIHKGRLFTKEHLEKSFASNLILD